MFGVLCGLDKTVVNVLLSSVLPNELGRDIQQNLTNGGLSESGRVGGWEGEGRREIGKEGGRKGGWEGRRRDGEIVKHINFLMYLSLITDIQKTLYSSTVCTMVFSTAEAVPLPVYGRDACRRPCHVIATQLTVTFPYTCRPVVGGVCSLPPGHGGEPPGGGRGGANT